MTINEIMNYVIETPENTNPAVLRGMLEQLDTGSSGMSLIPVEIQGRGSSTTGSLSAKEVFEGFLVGKRYEIIYIDEFNWKYYIGELRMCLKRQNDIIAIAQCPASGPDSNNRIFYTIVTIQNNEINSFIWNYQDNYYLTFQQPDD